MIFSVGFESKSPFLPAFTTQFYVSSIDKVLANRLKEIVLIEEPNILSMTTADTTDPEWANWLTGRLWQYNFLNFNYPEVAQLKTWFKQQYLEFTKEVGVPSEKVYIQCWANLVRNDGKSISPHHHADAHGSAPLEYSYLSGNITIQAENTHTYFRNPLLDKQFVKLRNFNGELIMFPSYIVHWADPNLSDDPRLTIAFDLITEPVYNMLENSNYILLD